MHGSIENWKALDDKKQMNTLQERTAPHVDGRLCLDLILVPVVPIKLIRNGYHLLSQNASSNGQKSTNPKVTGTSTKVYTPKLFLDHFFFSR